MKNNHIIPYVVSQGAPKGRRAIIVPHKVTPQVIRTIVLIALKQPIALGFWAKPTKAYYNALIVAMRQDAHKVIETNKTINQSRIAA